MASYLRNHRATQTENNWITFFVLFSALFFGSREGREVKWTKIEKVGRGEKNVERYVIVLGMIPNKDFTAKCVIKSLGQYRRHGFSAFFLCRLRWRVARHWGVELRKLVN